MTPLSCLLDLARRQDRVLSLDDLRQLGCSKEAIRHLVRTQRLRRIYPAVYALEGPLAPRGVARAAVLSCAPRAAADRLTAAFLDDLIDRAPVRPQVVTTRGTGAKGPRRVDLHRSRTLMQKDVGLWHGFPVTKPARTVIDCARVLDDALKRLVRRAEHHGLDLTTLDRPGIPANLRRLLDRYVVGSGLTANELEARFYEICARIGVPRPEIQTRMPERRRIDFLFRDAGLIAETDGRAVHDTAIAFTDDRARDRAHTIAGFQTMRFTWLEVERERPVERDLLAYFSRR